MTDLGMPTMMLMVQHEASQDGGRAKDESLDILDSFYE